MEVEALEPWDLGFLEDLPSGVDGEPFQLRWHRPCAAWPAARQLCPWLVQLETDMEKQPVTGEVEDLVSQQEPMEEAVQEPVEEPVQEPVEEATAMAMVLAAPAAGSSEAPVIYVDDPEPEPLLGPMARKAFKPPREREGSLLGPTARQQFKKPRVLATPARAESSVGAQRRRDGCGTMEHRRDIHIAYI